MGSVPEIEPECSENCQLSATGEWLVGDAVIVGVVAYTASVVLLMLTMFAVYSIPSWHSRLWIKGLDSGVYTIAGLVGGIVFGAPLVMCSAVGETFLVWRGASSGSAAIES
jgi:uncharacterized membrane protein YphA (DoxX/SURF4 family)